MRPRDAVKHTAGQHSFTREQSLSFWQRRWKEAIDGQPETRRQETIERARALLSATTHRSALHDMAVCYGLGGDDGRIRD